MNQVEEVLTFIQLFNQLCYDRYHEILTDVPQLIFLNGLCYYYAKMLSHTFQPSILYSNGSHIIVKINEFYYDACGIVLEYKEYYPLRKDDLPLLQTWGIIKSNIEDKKINDLMDSIQLKAMEMFRNQRKKKQLLKE